MIVISAPTGQIGSKLVSNLLRHEEPLRLITRNPDRLPADVRARAEIVVGSHSDRDVVDRALEGADALFWLMPAAATARSPYEAYVTASIAGADAVVRHEVPRVVVVSALGRDSQIYGGHASASHVMEDLFRSTGAHVRALALPTFMDNMLRQIPAIRTGIITGTLPAAFRMPWVATKDIADIAAGFLLDDAWTGQDTVSVLGAEDLSYDDIAEILTDALGTPVRYQPSTRDADKQFLIGHGFSEAMAQSLMDMDRAGERGINNAIPRTVDNTTPTTFRSFAEETIKPTVAL